MKLERYGFFAELDHGEQEGGSLLALRGTAAYDDLRKQRIASYLKSSALYIGCPGIVFDVLLDSRAPIGSPNILTDGEWAWPGDLAYYVVEYDVPIPKAMIDSIEHNNWSMPSNVNLAELEL